MSAPDKPASAPDKKDAPHHRRPWRDNLEAVTMAITFAVMLKYFVVEAYKIPTGSMQPTLLGNEDTGLFDRIIVDKLSYHFRDPVRFEVVVFKYPLDRSKNFIKRLVGMPGEQLRIENGDLFTRPDSSAEWKVLRRPRPVQREVWKRINLQDPRYASWRTDNGAKTWTIQGRESVEARGEGSVKLPNDGGSVMDVYGDGYPGKMAEKLAHRGAGEHPVGDLRIEGEVKAHANLKSFSIELREGGRVYTFTLPGPGMGGKFDDPWTVKVPDNDKVFPNQPNARVVTSHLPGGRSKDTQNGEGRSFDWRLPVDKSISFAAQNMDDLLTLEIDGEIVWEIEIPAARDQRSSITLRTSGDADLSDLELYRDIYYTTERVKKTEFTIPPGNYVMMGDNTQDSSDSREWTLASYKWNGPGSEGQWVRGNMYPPLNPAEVTGAPEGPRLFFRDEWGELHTFFRRGDSQGPTESAPFVPRDLITGRAVIVFWPFSPSLNVWRLKFVH